MSVTSAAVRRAALCLHLLGQCGKFLHGGLARGFLEVGCGGHRRFGTELHGRPLQLVGFLDQSREIACGRRRLNGGERRRGPLDEQTRPA
jgi:hypothetical protein